MIQALKKIFLIEDLRKRIIFTLMLLLACRVGSYIPVPGIDGEAAVQLFKAATGGSQNLFQLMDVFSGGAFAQMTIVALGVMPYISASIILQLLVALIPSFQREIKENYEAGRKKLGKWTRILTVGIAFFQSGLFAKYALQLHSGNPILIASELLGPRIFGAPWFFYLIMMFAMTAGTIMLMWFGEQITEKGIGNGISLIITIGILSSLPTTIGAIIQQLNLEAQTPGRLTFLTILILAVVFVCIIVGTILIIQGQRKVPLQYARRTIGPDEMQDGTAHIPLKINYAGVIPVIFASAFLMLPATVAQFVGQGNWLGRVAGWLSPGHWPYLAAYVFLIIFFTYFWTATQFHPEQIASDMKKGGAFIPGIRQGKPTQDYLESTMSRITFAGALFLAAIAVLPTMIGKILRVDATITYFFGGTSLLILVGVVLDTTKQIESHLLMKKYDGFMKIGRLRNRI